MHSPKPQPKNDAALAIPPVPLTIEGSSVLHQMLRFDWAAWRALELGERNRLLTEAERALQELERRPNGGSALYSVLGHKADLMLVHFRSSFDELKSAELQLSSLGLWDYVELADSYLSVVELGLYDSSVKTYQSLAERGIAPHTPEWDAAIKEVRFDQVSAEYALFGRFFMGLRVPAAKLGELLSGRLPKLESL